MSQVATLPKRSLVDSMAAKYEMEPQAFMGAVKATCIKGDCSNEQFAAFLMVAKEYDLNPLTKEIYAFPDRGGITPIVSIDGWMNLINSHPQFDGMEFVDSMGDDGKLYSVECKMYRKDRQRPTTVIEYMSECSRQTDPWKKWPNRMLRHKSAIQCARYAFGFSGIMEPDEYERMKDVTPAAQPSVMERLRSAPQQPTNEREGFDASFVHSETENALTGEIIDKADDGSLFDSRNPNNKVTDTDETPLSQSVDAGMKPAEGEVENPPAASPSNLPADHLWLLNTTRMLWGATKAGGDPEVFKNQRLAAMDQFPKPDDCDKRISEKANSVSRHCREIIEGSLDPVDGLAVIAGIVGVDQDDILRQAGAA